MHYKVDYPKIKIKKSVVTEIRCRLWFFFGKKIMHAKREIGKTWSIISSNGLLGRSSERIMSKIFNFRPTAPSYLKSQSKCFRNVSSGLMNFDHSCKYTLPFRKFSNIGMPRLDVFICFFLAWRAGPIPRHCTYNRWNHTCSMDKLTATWTLQQLLPFLEETRQHSNLFIIFFKKNNIK